MANSNPKTDNLVPFKPNDPRINRTGENSRIKQASKKLGIPLNGISWREFVGTCEGLLMKTKDEIKEVISSEKTPIFVVCLCSCILQDIRNGSFATISWLSSIVFVNRRDEETKDPSTEWIDRLPEDIQEAVIVEWLNDTDSDT